MVSPIIQLVKKGEVILFSKLNYGKIKLLATNIFGDLGCKNKYAGTGSIYPGICTD
jgi:hypothetical protein